MSKKFKTLYAKSSTGKVKQWSIEASGNTIIECWGYTDGKKQEQHKSVYGKNIGRSNATSPEQQCELECQSKWQKKIDEQYTTDKDSIKDYKDQEILLPMLALRYQERKHNIKFPCYVQPKLNGVRCVFQNNEFVSRGGKVYETLDHLRPELEDLDINVPDGEIYIHGMSFQEIVRRVKKYRKDKTEELEYWIYDQINKDTFEVRNKKIANNFSKNKSMKLVYVPTVEVNSEIEIKKWHDKWVQEGFEGVIIRNKEGLYKVKHRSADLQKYKMFEDNEFTIIGGHEGSGPDVGTVVFEVETTDHKKFSVRPKGTREMRAEWFKNLKKLIGKELTVRYQQLSDSNIPIFPVGIMVDANVRDYE